MRETPIRLTAKQAFNLTNIMIEKKDEHAMLNATQILERMKEETQHDISLNTIRRILNDFNLPSRKTKAYAPGVSQDSFFVLANQLRVLMDDIGENPLPEFKRMFEMLVERRAEEG